MQHAEAVPSLGDKLFDVSRSAVREHQRVPRPVEARGFAEHGAAGAGEDRADELLLLVVVGGLGVVAHVHRGEALRALVVLGVRRVRQPAPLAQSASSWAGMPPEV